MNFDASLTVGFSLGGLGESSYFSLPRLEEEYVSRVQTRIVKEGEEVKEEDLIAWYMEQVEEDIQTEAQLENSSALNPPQYSQDPNIRNSNTK